MNWTTCSAKVRSLTVALVGSGSVYCSAKAPRVANSPHDGLKYSKFCEFMSAQSSPAIDSVQGRARPRISAAQDTVWPAAMRGTKASAVPIGFSGRRRVDLQPIELGGERLVISIPQQLGGSFLHAAGLFHRPAEVVPLDLLQVLF